jgi:hypothetical protein
MHRVKVRRVLLPLFALVLTAGAPSPVLGGTDAAKQGVAAKRGFHPDGRPWLWPGGTQLITDQEARGDFAIVLEGTRLDSHLSVCVFGARALYASLQVLSRILRHGFSRKSSRVR